MQFRGEDEEHDADEGDDGAHAATAGGRLLTASHQETEPEDEREHGDGTVDECIDDSHTRFVSYTCINFSHRIGQGNSPRVSRRRPTDRQVETVGGVTSAGRSAGLQQ